MSREAKAHSSSSHPHQTSRTSTATQHPPQPPVKEPEHSNKENEQIEEDDSDFVLVVNKKKHQQQIESARKQRQSYEHQAEDYDHHNNYSRRRKYRDRGGGGEKGFRRKKNQDKENTQHKTGSTSSSSSHAASVTLPTISSPPPLIEPKPHPQQIQTIAPSARSFSVVVACGKSALQKQQTAPLPQSPPPPPPLPSQDQNESPVRLTNRQILMVVKPKQESLGTGPSISSSIPDTSSLTSEETLDSIERKAFSCVDVESNEGSFTTGVVEYVDAPAPKINPWVANRNAAQVLLSGSSTLPGFPSVSESSGSSINGEVHKPASPDPSKLEVQKTRKQSKEIQRQKHEIKAPQEHKTPPQSPTSFSEAVTSPKPKQEQFQQKPQPPKKQEPELPKKQDGESNAREPSQEQKQAPPTETTPALPLQDQKPVYVREMQNGFRPGRGRGSYSASASAGRKIPSRTSVLMKVISGDRAEDWPTLGEALSSRAHKLSSSGDEESGSGGEGVKKPTTAIGEDAVDSHVKVVDKDVVELNNKSNEGEYQFNYDIP